jgi:hypothetical protein
VKNKTYLTLKEQKNKKQSALKLKTFEARHDNSTSRFFQK